VCILKGHFASAVAITPDGRFVVSASGDKTLKVWDLNSGTELRTLSGHTDGVNAVAITPDGKLAVSASNDDTLKVWDIDSGTELNTLIGHDYWVRTVAISPNGRFVVSGSWDQNLKVWDLDCGEEIMTFNSEGELNACAFSPDGMTIVAGGRSDRINFLRLEGIESLEGR
jgi:WD40 repeat protein